MSELRRGEVILRDATRSFTVRADKAHTLKGLVIGKRAGGPAPVPALQSVTLHIEPGETVGIVGRNGAGKTSTLRVLAGIIPLQSGEAGTGGRTVALLELGSGFSREFSGRENVYLQGALYGLGKDEIEQRIDSITAFSELEEFIDVPVKTYSAGMYVRLGFSIAAHLSADVMLIDEVLAVGDEAFQRKCLRRISDHLAAGTTVVLVSHDAAAVERVCERVVVLDAGRVVFDGPTAEGLLHYHRLMGIEHGGGLSLRQVSDSGLEIADVELRDAEHRSSSVFRTGGSLQVVVSLKATRPVKRPSLALEVRAQDGRRVFGTTTPVELSADGTAELQFEVADLVLLGGDYDLVLGVVDSLGEAPLERTVRFSVAADPELEGIVDLRGTWQQLTREEARP